MYKNTAGQFVGAQLVTAADGTAFTGTVTVRYTGGNGTQTIGSVSSGVCVHKGNGYHSYAPATAETNYDHVAFTFTGTGAIPVTLNVYPVTDRWATELPGAYSAGTAGAILGALTDFSTEEELVDAIWDEVQASHTTPDSFGEYLNAAITSIPNAAGIQSEVNDALVALNLDHLMAVEYSSASEVANGSVIARLASNTGAGTTADFSAFNNTSSSLRATDAALQVLTADHPGRITKNTALSAFMFMMVDGTDHVTPETGLTVTATRSLDGAAFAACANSVTEVSDGWYKINLAATDLNANVVALKFTATNADARNITIVTQPT